MGTQKCGSFAAVLVLPSRPPWCRATGEAFISHFSKKAFPNVPLISVKARNGYTCKLVRTRKTVLLWLHLRVYNTKEGNSPCRKKKKKKRQYFHLKAGRKHARQFVCGPKAAHLRQKGKLYLFNFPRQTSHNSEHSFAISCKELSFSCCNLCSFISSLPSPLLLSLSITRPIHGYPLKCPICRGVAVLTFTSSYRTF